MGNQYPRQTKAYSRIGADSLSAKRNGWMPTSDKPFQEPPSGDLCGELHQVFQGLGVIVSIARSLVSRLCCTLCDPQASKQWDASKEGSLDCSLVAIFCDLEY